uniref:PAS domain-containing protein n=1 Tax=Alexandrium monilatum TaxID=311494 RepID=A0A7S4VYS1_9DINO
MAEAISGKDLSTCEEQVLRSQIDGSFKANLILSPIAVVMRCASSFPIGSVLAHMREPATFIVIVAIACTSFTAVAKHSSSASLKRNAAIVSYTTLGVRLVLHAITVVFDGDTHLFLKLMGVFQPVSASKVCSSPADFGVFLVLQNLLVLVHFGCDWERTGAWIVASFVISVFCLDAVRQQAVQRRLRIQLASTCAELEQVAEAATKEVFGRLCDASASLSADGHIIEASPQLPSLLGTMCGNLQGRLFASLCHRSEAQELAGFPGTAAGEPGKVQHQQVQLADIYGQPVSVHVFYTTFVRLNSLSTTVLGISETWCPSAALARGPSHAQSRWGEGDGGDAAPEESMAGFSRVPSRTSARSRARNPWEARDGLDAAPDLAAPRRPSRIWVPSRTRSRPDKQDEDEITVERLWAGTEAPVTRPLSLLEASSFESPGPSRRTPAQQRRLQSSAQTLPRAD